MAISQAGVGAGGHQAGLADTSVHDTALDRNTALLVSASFQSRRRALPGRRPGNEAANGRRPQRRVDQRAGLKCRPAEAPETERRDPLLHITRRVAKVRRRAPLWWRRQRIVMVFVPVRAFPRRTDSVETVWAALAAAAKGLGHRQVAEQVGVHATTVRGWLRRARANTDIMAIRAAVARSDLDHDASEYVPRLDSSLAYMVNAIVGAGCRSSRATVGLCRSVASKFVAPENPPTTSTVRTNAPKPSSPQVSKPSSSKLAINRSQLEDPRQTQDTRDGHRDRLPPHPHCYRRLNPHRPLKVPRP